MEQEKKKILIVDDEAAFTQMVKLNLEGTGKYKVRVENKGTFAVSVAREFKPDLILLDIIIPDVAGSEIAAQLKEDEGTKHIPVVFLTALVTKKEEKVEGNSCRIVGGNTFIAKPVNLKDLISCIDATLGETMIQFPKEFFWGAATSAYQVEGGNSNSDWWEWEKRTGLKDTSGAACRHYELYKSDFDLAKQLNHNAHRLSIEWSRIEPEEGRFSGNEMEHYRDVMLALQERGITPIVTLHHFTNPIWFARLGGWENKKALKYFARYVETVANALCDKVGFWVTINEPLVYVFYSYILGEWPPQAKSLLRAGKVTDNLILAHVKTYELIRRIYKKHNLAYPAISIAKNTQAFHACLPGLRNRFSVRLRDYLYNYKFINKLIRHKSLDFIGINYYSRSLIEVRGWRLHNLLTDTCISNHSQLKKNSLGWDIYPEGLYELLMGFKRYGLPLFILENGICTGDDWLRWEYIREHLKSVHAAMEKGANVLGYTYWSLLDNFEWDKGFSHRFGLIEVDYNSYERRVRESARKLAEVCKTGSLE